MNYGLNHLKSSSGISKKELGKSKLERFLVNLNCREFSSDFRGEIVVFAPHMPGELIQPISVYSGHFLVSTNIQGPDITSVRVKTLEEMKDDHKYGSFFSVKGGFKLVKRDKTNHTLRPNEPYCFGKLVQCGYLPGAELHFYAPKGSK